jgi:hypothetical protein
VIKRLLNFIFICAFMAGGWGTVLAANWCLYQRCIPSASENKQMDAPEEKASEDGHCSKSSQASGHEQHQAKEVKKSKPVAGKESVAQKGINSRCGHCVSAPQVPVRNSFKASASETRRDAGSCASQLAKHFILPGAASFPALAPSQGAPPTPSSRRHLLINIFLI